MMSNYPPTPSFEATSNYAQQWPQSHQSQSSAMPPILPPNFPLPPDFAASTPHQPLDNGGQMFDYDMSAFQANSRLPGLGALGAAGSLPPPPFPFMPPFHSQFPPPPFAPVQMPPLRYPPIPLPSAPIHTQQNGSLTNDAPSGTANTVDSRGVHTPNSRYDGDREEGELTDKEGMRSMNSQSQVRSSSRANSRQAFSARQLQPGRNARTSKGGRRKDHSAMDVEISATSHQNNAVPAESPGKGSSDLEEGEASSIESRSTSRDSGSPYNPPMPTPGPSLVPQQTLNIQAQEFIPPAPAPENQRNGSSHSSGKDSQDHSSARSPAQLRVQAQGALLSLAPHNIRYTELVGEGINPAVLKQLYEEVGIKVTTPQPDPATPMQNSRPKPDAPPGELSRVDHDQAAHANIPENQEATVQEINAMPPRSSTSQSDTTKPMERKEVIARMLAAKAAKSSRPSASPQADTPKVPSDVDPISREIEKPLSITPSSELPAKEKEVRTREKNKAQTELARQRMEQLKKQGLMRNHQRSQPDPISQDTSQAISEIDRTPAPTNTESITIQHPLPDRPPIPETGAANRLPGLFMTESEPSPTADSSILPSQAPSQAPSLDPTPQPRATQRKRPRASDFDEPTMPKRAFNHGPFPDDRLIIDISDDDEFYGDDENDNMEVDTTYQAPQGAEWSTGLTREFLPQNGINYLTSKSATPLNSRNSEQEDLRKKELAIQAMRRQIAELEQRKKAKLTASGTQSPRALDSSGSSLAENSVGADIDIGNASPAEPLTGVDSSGSASMDVVSKAAPPQQPASPNLDSLSTSLSPRVLSSLDATQLDKIRFQIQRKKEIESGLPALDAEIRKSQARLAQFKQEEERILLEIARGEEGRRQLLEELANLGIDINGISLEDLDAARSRSDAAESPVILDQASNFASSELDDTSPNLPASEPPGHGETAPAEANEAPSSLSGNTDTRDVEQYKEPSPVSFSESPGSAMDESDDSSSDDSSSVSQESSRQSLEPTQELDASENHEDSPGADELDSDSMDLEDRPHTLPERPRFTNAESTTNGHTDSDTRAEPVMPQSSRESSSESEAYEPPEPELNPGSPESVGSSYTPPLSVASPGPVEPSEATRPALDQLQADELLTEKDQEQEVDSKNHDQVGVLDPKQPTEEPGRHFVPYSSPLKIFKAYRYHPAFTDSVSGGYRSLTYSHNIDPMKYLCPFEASGGVCNDHSCEFQHFRDMTLSDDKILVQMGSLREGKTPEEKDHYIAGLKQIINEMRRDKVKDFNTVATEIAAYRRRFLQDPSRVLPL